MAEVVVNSDIICPRATVIVLRLHAARRPRFR
jgi:hypothetical protein